MSFSERVRRFFPDVNVADGPFGLLGLAPAPTPRDRVYEALRSRIAELDAAAGADSEDARAVREALHVAASQLAAPELQDTLLNQFRAAKLVDEAPRGERPDAERVTREPAGSRAGLNAEDHAILRYLLASSGGWNRSAARKVARFGAAHDLSLVDLRVALGMTARSEHNVRDGLLPKAMGGPLHTTADSGTQEELFAPPEERSTRALVSISSVLLLIASAGLIAITLLTVLERRAAIAAADRELEAAAQEVSAGEIADSPRLDPTSETALLSPQEAYDALNGLDVSRISAEPSESIDRFDLAFRSLAAGWDALPSRLVANIPLLVREVLFAAADASGAEPSEFTAVLAELLSERNARVSDWVFAAAVVDALAGGDVPTSAVSSIAALRSSIEAMVPERSQRFDDGIDAIAMRLVPELARTGAGEQGGVAQWVSLAQRLDRFTPADPPRPLVAIETLATTPAADLASIDAQRAATVVADALEEDTLEPLARLLVELLSAPASTAPNAPSVTRGVLVAGRWPELVSLQIPETPSVADRRAATERILAALGEDPDAEPSELQRRWVALMDDLDGAAAAQPRTALALSLAASRGIEAAHHAWLNDESAGLTSLDEAESAWQAAATLEAGDDLSRRAEWWRLGGSAGWANNWMSALRSEDRARALNALRADGGPDTTLEHELLTEAAFGPADAPRRRSALDVLGLGDPRRIAIAALEVITRVDRRSPLGELLDLVGVPAQSGATPGPADAHRGLVRVLSAEIAALRYPGLERIEQELNDSVARRVQSIAAAYPAAQAPSIARTPMEALVLRTRAALRDAQTSTGRRPTGGVATSVVAAPGTVAGALHDAVRARAEAAFVLAELIAVEQPEDTEAIATELERFRAELGSARSATQQLFAGERAMLRLWGVRLGWRTP